MPKHLLFKPGLWALLLSAASFSLSSQAYYSVIENGEVLSQGEYQMNLESQFVTNSGSGVNLVGRFDSYLTEESKIRGMIGAGRNDFHAAAFYTWVPIPDYDQQPAIGLSSGLLYGMDEGDNELSVRFHPFVAKKFEVEIGDISPYVSIPFKFR